MCWNLVAASRRTPFFLRPKATQCLFVFVLSLLAVPSDVAAAFRVLSPAARRLLHCHTVCINTTRYHALLRTGTLTPRTFRTRTRGHATKARVAAATAGRWLGCARARRARAAHRCADTALVQEQRSLQIARDFSHSRLLATTFFAWRRWAKRYINLCHFSPPHPSRPLYFTLVLCLSRFRLIYANAL